MPTEEKDEQLEGLSGHELEAVLDLLFRHRLELGLDRVIQLEWYFLPALGYEPNVPTLYRELSSNPDFFVQMVCLVYRPATGEAPTDQSEEARAAPAMNAMNLLHVWTGPPGVGDDGHLDPDRLRDWVRQARALLKDADRQAVGDSEIGASLAGAPADEEGRWPPVAVCDLLEELDSDDIDRGLERQIYNNRGVTSRGLDTGGGPEWELVERYRGQARRLRTEWTHAARVFTRLADRFEAEAKHHDSVAEGRRRGLDV